MVGVNSVHFSPDSSLLVVGSDSHNHNIYSISTLTVESTYAATCACNSAKFSPNQQYIAFGLTNSSAVILNAADYSYNMIINSSFNPIRQIDFNNNSTRLIICGGGGYEIWGVPSGALISSENNYTSEAMSCTFSSTNTFVVGESTGIVYYYTANYALNQIVYHSWGGGGSGIPVVMGLAFNPSASAFASALSNNRQRITFTTSNNGNIFGSIGWSSSVDYLCVDYSPDNLLLAEGENGNLGIYDITTGGGWGGGSSYK